MAVLERLIEQRSAPQSIMVNHGPEFEGQALDASAYQHDIRLAFIRPSKLVRTATSRASMAGSETHVLTSTGSSRWITRDG